MGKPDTRSNSEARRLAAQTGEPQAPTSKHGGFRGMFFPDFGWIAGKSEEECREKAQKMLAERNANKE